MKVAYSYLREQFLSNLSIVKNIRRIVNQGDYTLGREVRDFEINIAKRTGAKFAIGVGNGTDALFLSLKALDIGKGHEVITTPFTFVSTAGAISTAGAKPVFVDTKNDYNIDETKIESAITKKTKAIMPVHWGGRPCELEKIRSIAKKYNLKIIQDSAQAIDSKYKNKNLIYYGDLCAYSMHPLKNLNIWGDGGFILTQNKKLAQKLSLLRNHGLINRENSTIFAFNSRLDSIQAAVANYQIKNKLNYIINKRIKNAHLFDRLLKSIPNVTTIVRKSYLKETFHLYQINVKNRDKLIKFLIRKGIEAKIHYPIPIHLQKAAKYLKYKKNDFPNAEKIANSTLTLPIHEFVKEKQIKYISNLIKSFYS